MSEVRDAPEVVIRNLLRDDQNWDADQTLGVTPNIHHGWVDLEDEQPQITVSNPDEQPIDGGATGYAGINPDSGTPTQRIRGVMQVNVWVANDWTDHNARQLSYHMKEMVRTIIEENADGADSDLSYLSYNGSDRRPDENDDPVGPDMVWRYQIPVVYGYDTLRTDG